MKYILWAMLGVFVVSCSENGHLTHELVSVKDVPLQLRTEFSALQKGGFCSRRVSGIVNLLVSLGKVNAEQDLLDYFNSEESNKIDNLYKVSIIGLLYTNEENCHVPVFGRHELFRTNDGRDKFLSIVVVDQAPFYINFPRIESMPVDPAILLALRKDTKNFRTNPLNCLSEKHALDKLLNSIEFKQLIEKLPREIKTGIINELKAQTGKR